MKDILFDDIDLTSEITNVHAVEKSYDYFEVNCDINGETYRVLDTRNSRCSDMVFTDTSHKKNHAEWIMRKLGEKNVREHMAYTFNHNESSWEEPVGDFDGYYGDGLDHIEELWYMD